MGSNHWNPQRWHRNHARPRRHSSLWGPAIIVCLALITGGVAAAQGATLDAGPRMIGICHATGDPAQPWVYLVVDRDGADHGAHQEHATDLLDVLAEEDCLNTMRVESTDASSDCNHSSPEGTGSARAAAGPGSQAAANHSNGTQNHVDPDVVGLCDADVAVNHTATTNGSWVRFDVRVDSIGTGEANDVLMDATLPDVGRDWHLVGSAPQACLLEHRDLSCEFGDLPPNASRTVTVKAARCADDCGDDLEATAHVTAYNDGNATNNQATAILIVEDCPRGQTPTTTPTQTAHPSPSQQPTNTTGNGSGASNATTGNASTGNQTSGNQTNATQPQNTSQTPAPSDASVAQRADQSEDQVLLTIVVRSLGQSPATNVSLMDTLPDVRRAWHLSGPDAAECTLDGRWLNCWFGDLDPGASRTITVKAYTDRLPCGQHLTNNVSISSDGDANPRNNRSGAGIEAHSC